MTQKFLVLDMETNGIGSMRPPQQTITQFGWILFDESGNTIESGNDIVLGAKVVNIIYDNSLTLEEINQKGIPLDQAFEKMRKMIDSNTTIFAHNADFDIGLLQYANLSLPNSKIVCTMKNSIEFCKLHKTGYAARYPGYKFPRLSELANKLNINIDASNLHDALYDCKITKECVLKGREIGLFY
jgi:DNA polymerase III alpha subunit (gram-positive type)